MDASFCTGGVSSLQHPFTASPYGSLPLSVLPANEADGPRQVLPDGPSLQEAREIVNTGDEFLEFFGTLRMRTENSAPSRASSTAGFQVPISPRRDHERPEPPPIRFARTTDSTLHPGDLSLLHGCCGSRLLERPSGHGQLSRAIAE